MPRRWRVRMQHARSGATACWLGVQSGALIKKVAILPTSTAYGVDSSLRGFEFAVSNLEDKRKYSLLADSETSRRIWVQTLQVFANR